MLGRALSGAGTSFEWPEAVGYSRAPFASLPAEGAALQAGPAGVALGLFGWADPVAGVLTNLFTAGFQLGFVLPTFNGWNWQRAYIQCGFPFPLKILRAGMPVVLAVSGNFRTKFPQGGVAGSRVWADPLTGLPYGDSNSGANIATPWTLMQSGGCNANLQISSFAAPLLNLT